MANQNGTVDEQWKTIYEHFKNTVEKRAQIDDWKKKWWTIHIGQIKSTITFTYSPNKCHNIFTKHLFSVVVGHSFIFYYFILTYKKLTPRKKCTNGRLKKKSYCSYNSP